MKKLFFLLLITITLISCTKVVTIHNETKEDKLPILVTNLQKAGIFDTVYQIKSDSIIYVFDKNKNYQNTINLTVNHKESDVDSFDVLVSFVCGVLLIVVIVLLRS